MSELYQMFVGIALGAGIAVVALLFHKWADRPPAPIIVKDANMIADYITAYCRSTRIDIDKVCLVAHELGDGMTVMQVQPIDFYPEIWS